MAEAGPHDVEVIGDLPMQTRDGVRLLADVYRPRGAGPFPVLVHRTPYNKRGGRPYPNMDRPFNEGHLFASHGYLTVVQDTRGRGASDGEFVPFVNEAEDGYDTVEWAATLDGSSGAVGMFGQSYDAMCQYLTVPLAPPHLRAATPVTAPIAYFDHCVYTSGAFNLAWMLHYAIINLVLRGRDGEAALKVLRDYVLYPDDPARRRLNPEIFAHRPISDWGDRLREFAPYFADYVRHGTDDAYWWQLDLRRQAGAVGIPMLHVSSWYDGFQKGTLGAYAYASAGDGAGNGSEQALIMGPWAHAIYTDVSSGKAGERDFGPEAPLAMHEIQLDWFARHLKGETGGAAPAPVRIFVMGSDRWREEQEWPLARTEYTPLYLGAGRGGEGRLSWEPPGGEEPDGYRYDPDDPVPTIGGHHLGVFGVPNGPFDQRPSAARPDVLVYTSEPFEADLEITGPLAMTLYASSSAPDTDFVVKVIDVLPDGYAHPISEGILRCRFRDSQSEPALLTPGQVYALPVDLYAVSHVVPAGHRLRVHVTSSDFPQWDANPNTGEPFGASATIATAEQRVFHDELRPSHLRLPIIRTTAQ
jgi:putative CocE/NonD family hydrolase